MKCPLCGNEKDDNSDVCCDCGYPLDTAGRDDTGRTGFVRFLSALLHAGMYVMLMFAVQIAVTSAYMIPLAFDKVMAYPMAEQAIAEVSEFALGKVVELALLSNLLTILIIALRFTVKNRHPLVEMGFRQVNPMEYMQFAVLGLAMNVVISVTMSILPLPQGLLDSLETQYSYVGSGNIVIEILSLTLVTGIAEEIVFRGMVNSRLARGMSRRWVIIVSSLIFGAAHVTPLAMVYSFLMGLLFSCMYERFDSIKPSAICHIFFNTAAYFITELTGAWMWVIYAASIVISAVCIYRIFFRRLTFYDYLMDFRNVYPLTDMTDDERAMIEEMRRLRKGNLLSRQDIQKLADKWDKMREKDDDEEL